jgi:hypothetical protein
MKLGILKTNRDRQDDPEHDDRKVVEREVKAFINHLASKFFKLLLVFFCIVESNFFPLNLRNSRGSFINSRRKAK